MPRFVSPIGLPLLRTEHVCGVCMVKMPLRRTVDLQVCGSNRCQLLSVCKRLHIFPASVLFLMATAAPRVLLAIMSDVATSRGLCYRDSYTNFALLAMQQELIMHFTIKQLRGALVATRNQNRDLIAKNAKRTFRTRKDVFLGKYYASNKQ